MAENVAKNSAPLAIVTGAAGWLGQRLVQSLASGLPESEALRAIWRPRRVRALVLPGTDTSELRRILPEIEIVEGDIRNPTTGMGGMRAEG